MSNEKVTASITRLNTLKKIEKDNIAKINSIKSKISEASEQAKFFVCIDEELEFEGLIDYFDSLGFEVRHTNINGMYFIGWE